MVSKVQEGLQRFTNLPDIDKPQLSIKDGAFDTSEATVLTTEEMGLLVVEGSGTDIKEKLEACGAEDGDLCVTK